MYDDVEPPEPASSGGNTTALEVWKQQLRQQFELWLEDIERLPETHEQTEAPDLYSLYEALTALRNETRQGNRKSAELFSRLGESFGRFEDEVRRLRDQLSRSEPAPGDKAPLPRPYALALVELVDRLHRLGAALERPPRPGRFAFLSRDGHWRKAWANWQHGFSILVTHFEKLLEQAGVERLNTAGATFNPVTMLAVATIAADGQPPNVVAEEVAPGYLWCDEILRPAEVKITR
ncbi:MAG: nucleotide exchange factor GrpE [Verrucomicrobia bacterium]|nr:nucleotide exchange factor GrpE [Verrucomicrobiota bacterium]